MTKTKRLRLPDQLLTSLKTPSGSIRQGLSAHAIALALGLLVNTVQAATITVNSSLDDDVACTLRNAIKSANTDVSVGGCDTGSGDDLIDLTGIAGDTVTLVSRQLNAKSNITIQGNGVTIDADNLSQVLNVSAGTLTIENLQLINGNGQVFPEIVERRHIGGCVSIIDAVFNVNRSTISNCSASSGGGVMSVNSKLAFSNSAINNCSAISSGGGLFLSGGTLNFLDSTINGSSSGFLGGGFKMEQATAMIVGSTISENSALEGGGLSAESTQLTLSNTTISDNSVDTGGGISLRAGTALITDSTISNNTATGEGGAGLWCLQNGKVTISRTVLSGNSAGSTGGGISLRLGCSVDFLDSTLSNNDATKGGGVYSENGPFNASNSRIEQNSSTDSGGGIYITGSKHSISKSTLSGNNSDKNGGGIYSASAELSLSEVTLSSNTVALQGGGIYQASGNISITGSTLDLNTSPGSGGGIFISSGTNSVTSSTLSGNQSGGNGGAVFSNATFKLKDSTLSGNSAAVRGGGLYAWHNTIQTITNSTLSGNYAELGAAAVAVDESTVNVFNSTIVGHKSAPSNIDGSVWITDGGSFSISNSILHNPDDPADCNIADSSFGTATPVGINFVRNKGNCSFTGGLLIAGDSMLGPLSDNGGSTLTHLPMVGSPVIDIGDNTRVPKDLSRDQRGSLYPRFDGTYVDLGSVEVTNALPQLIIADGFED